MAETWTKNVRSYLEFESTPGSLPTGGADKRPQSFGIMPVPQINQREIRPIGNDYPSGYQRGLEWCDLTIVGGQGAAPTVDFVGINYPLEAMFGAATPTNPSANTYQRVYAPGTSLGRTFSLDYGDPNVAANLKRVLYCFITQLSFSANINELTFGGSGKGKTVAFGSLTPAGSPADIAMVTPNPFIAGLYLANTYGGLGTAGASTGGALVGRFFNFNIDTGVRADTLAPIKPSNNSWEVQKPMTPSGTVSMLLGADATGWGYLTQLRANSTIFGRYEVIGSVIEDTIAYLFAIDFAFQLSQHFNQQDFEGLDSIELSGGLVQNSDLTGIKITTRTALAAL